MTPRVALYCILGGLPPTLAALGAGHFGWWWISGIVLAASFVPIALFGPRRPLAQFGVIVPVLLIVTSLLTWTEALIFVKTPEVQQNAARNLLGSLAMYTLIAAVLAVLAPLLKLPRDATATAITYRSIPGALLMLVVCGLAYTLYYLVFGGITYQFFTRQYFPNAAQLVAPLGLWFWAIQIGRGIGMTLAVLPAIYTLRLSRAQAAIAIGMLIWVAGGLSPLLVPNTFMGATQRFIHVIEILTQNGLLGVTAVLLLRPKLAPMAQPSASAAARA